MTCKKSLHAKQCHEDKPVLPFGSSFGGAVERSETEGVACENAAIQKKFMPQATPSSQHAINHYYAKLCHENMNIGNV